jgi:hypothetical protein
MCFWIACAVAAMVAWGAVTPLSVARAQPAPPRGGPSRDVLNALGGVRSRYGADAVMIEGFLMGHAIEGGSVLETSVTVAGIEELNARRYLTFKLDTGIVYNDHDVSPETRTGRIWTRIVERTLRRFRSIKVPADGMQFFVTFTHRPYVEEPGWRVELNRDHGTAESVAFYLSNSDVAEFLTARITAQQLLDRTTVLVDGAPQRVVAEPPEPTPSAAEAP